MKAGQRDGRGGPDFGYGSAPRLGGQTEPARESIRAGNVYSAWLIWFGPGYSSLLVRQSVVSSSLPLI